MDSDLYYKIKSRLIVKKYYLQESSHEAYPIVSKLFFEVIFDISLAGNDLVR